MEIYCHYSFQGDDARAIEFCREAEKTGHNDNGYCNSSALPRHDPTEERLMILEKLFPKPGGHVLSPDFGQIQRWAVREMGLEDYTWKISEAALHGEFGLVCPCIFNCSRLYLRSRFRVCIAHGGIFPR